MSPLLHIFIMKWVFIRNNVVHNILITDNALGESIDAGGCKNTVDRVCKCILGVNVNSGKTNHAPLWMEGVQYNQSATKRPTDAPR